MNEYLFLFIATAYTSFKYIAGSILVCHGHFKTKTVKFSTGLKTPFRMIGNVNWTIIRYCMTPECLSLRQILLMKVWRLIFNLYFSPILNHGIYYHILLIICGKKLSCFLQIISKPRKFCGEFLHVNTMKACKSW